MLSRPDSSHGPRRERRIKKKTSAATHNKPRGSYPAPTVGALVTRSDGSILLARSHKWRGLFTVPGGHVEVGEELKEALVREVEEETGLKVRPIRLLLVQEAIYPPEFYEKKHFVFFDYLCQLVAGEVRLDTRELQEHLWVEPRRALTLPLEPFTRRMVEAYFKHLEEYVTSKRSGRGRH